MTSIRLWTLMIAILVVSGLSAAAQTGISLNDAAGVTWQVSVAQGGKITTMKVPHHPAPTGIMLNASDGTTGHSFWIGISTDGALKVTPVEYHSLQPLNRKLNNDWQIGVTGSGEAVTSHENTGAQQ